MARGNKRHCLSRKHAKLIEPRRSKDDLRLPPLIAPQSSALEPATRERLPSIEELDLLKAARGVFVPRPVPEGLGEDQVLILGDRVLKEYWINNTVYVMQAPIKNENSAVAERTTVSNRRLRYVLEVAQPPKQARACGNGPRCKFFAHSWYRQLITNSIG